MIESAGDQNPPIAGTELDSKAATEPVLFNLPRPGAPSPPPYKAHVRLTRQHFPDPRVHVSLMLFLLQTHTHLSHEHTSFILVDEASSFTTAEAIVGVKL